MLVILRIQLYLFFSRATLAPKLFPNRAPGVFPPSCSYPIA
jgi:hypothetical protein